MNDYLFQLAMVINTSHENFYENLLNIIIYVMYTIEREEDAVSFYEVAADIEEKIKLEFTEKEIRKAIRRGIQKGYIFESERKDMYSLSEKGLQKVHLENSDSFSKIIDEYIDLYDVSQEYDNETVRKLIHMFLYNCIGENIAVLISIIEGRYEASDNTISGLSNEERKIVNDFLDWENEEKDEILFQLISFSVDYSRLTVKKNSRQFGDLLNGKVFYLDANIFFRLMGINNLKRKETTQKFIEKCKEEKIKLLYTNITKQEIFESLDFHIDELKKFTKSYKGNGSALNKALESSNVEMSFYMEYYHWAKKNQSFNRFDEFKNYLKSQFYKCCNGIECEEVGLDKIDESLVDDLMKKKKQRAGYDNVVYDIKNLAHIKQKRRKSNGERVSWNTKFYLISADHKLVEWVDEQYSPRNPIAVLPSVWYSLMLKLSSLEKEGYKSFIEFVKLKYVQDMDVKGINRVIGLICQKTSDGELQDRLIDEIFDSNQENNKLTELSKEETEILVENVYDDILEQEREKGVLEGKKSAEKEKKQLSIRSIRIGKQIGQVEEKIKQLERTCASSAKRRRRRNVVFIIVGAIVMYSIFCCMVFKFLPVTIVKSYKWLFSFVPTGVLTFFSEKIFPVTYKENYENVQFERKDEMDSLKEKLEMLQMELD